jgi:hypothetical protein
MKPKPKRKPPTYKNPEARARQLAGLANVRIADHVPNFEHIEKVNAGGALASVSEEQKKQIVDMYCKGMSLRAISDAMGVSKDTVNGVKQSLLDHDSQFRNQMFKLSIKEKLQRVADGATERVLERLHEMSDKDAVLAMAISIDKLAVMDKSAGPETLHQHVHLHQPMEINNIFASAQQTKEIQ